MRSRVKNTWAWVVAGAVIALPILIVCCGIIAKQSERVKLTDNYRYLRSPEGEFILGYNMEEHQQELVDRMLKDWEPPLVGPDVDGYRVYRRVIVGHVAKTWDGEKHPAWLLQEDARIPGYFIIDLRRDTLHKSLSKQEWLEKLRGYGIKREPELFKPAWYDEILGRNKVCKE